MRKFITLAATLAASAALAGCAPGQLFSPNNVASLNANLKKFTAEVQMATIAACAVEPTAASVASLVAVGNPTVLTASAIATVICRAVSGQPAVAAAIHAPTTKKGGVEFRRLAHPRPVVIDGVTVRFR